MTGVLQQHATIRRVLALGESRNSLRCSVPSMNWTRSLRYNTKGVAPLGTRNAGAESRVCNRAAASRQLLQWHSALMMGAPCTWTCTWPHAQEICVVGCNMRLPASLRETRSRGQQCRSSSFVASPPWRAAQLLDPRIQDSAQAHWARLAKTHRKDL